ncbi:MAG: hypothetical protein HY717_01255 [Planctomycetes bacterium]|nr:hypothetical protein [Planctomycetota bacterium]
MSQRIRINPDGSIKLPNEVMEALKWTTGSYLEFELKGDRLHLWRVEVDLFAEAMKKPDQDGFDKILKKQKESQSKAFQDFEKKMKDPPKTRPEDRPEFWD